MLFSKVFLFFHGSGSDLKHSEMLEKNPAVSVALPFICPEIGQTSQGIPSLGIEREREKKKKKEKMTWSYEWRLWGEGRDRGQV